MKVALIIFGAVVIVILIVAIVYALWLDENLFK